jgi:hypothetical protein
MRRALRLANMFGGAGGFGFESASVAIASVPARFGSINLPSEACARRHIGSAASRRRAPVSQTDRRRRIRLDYSDLARPSRSTARKLRERQLIEARSFDQCPECVVGCVSQRSTLESIRWITPKCAAVGTSVRFVPVEGAISASCPTSILTPLRTLRDFSIRARGPADMLDAGYISQARNDGVEFRRVRIGA